MENVKTLKHLSGKVIIVLVIILAVLLWRFLAHHSVLYGRVLFAPTADFAGEWLNAYNIDDSQMAKRFADMIVQIENGDMAAFDFFKLVESMTNEKNIKSQKLPFRTMERYCGIVKRGKFLIVFKPHGTYWARLVDANKLFIRQDYDVKDGIEERPEFQKAKKLNARTFMINELMSLQSTNDICSFPN